MKKRRYAKSRTSEYSKLKTSVFASIFTSYKAHEKKSVFSTKFGKRVLSPAFAAVSSRISSSFFSGFMSRFAKFMLSLRLKVYGAFLMTFGIYTAAFYVLKNFVLSNDRAVFEIITGLLVALAAIPLTASSETLSGALTSSKFGKIIHHLTGIRYEAMETDAARGRVNHGFLFGVAAGVLSLFAAPEQILFAIASVLLVWIISASPEFGIILMTFLVPLVRTRQITVIVAVTIVSFLLKYIRRKRYVTIEKIDVAVFGIMLAIIVSAIAPIESASSLAALRYALYLTPYFLAANLMRSKDWLDRAQTSFILGVCICSALVVSAFVAGTFFPGVTSDASRIFKGSIVGDQISGSDKNAFCMIAAAAFPLALTHFIKPPFGKKRAGSALAMVLIAASLVVSKAIYASIAVVFSSILLLLIYSSKFVTLPVVIALLGGGSIAAFPSIADKINRFLGVGLDNFTSLRTSSWKSATEILSRSFIGGIGFRNDYVTSAVSRAAQAEPANHIYNTYLQFWTETGVVGFIALIVFAWFLLTACFTLFDKLDLSRTSPALRDSSMVRRNSLGETEASKGRKKSLSFADEYIITRRIAAGGTFCSIAGMLVYAMVDHIWYDERVFLAFWIIAGLCSAIIRSCGKEIADFERSYTESCDVGGSSEADIRVD